MASMGGRVDMLINKARGPFVFRLCGQTYHLLGSLIPEEGKEPKFAQLYIYDTENENLNRMNAVKGKGDETTIENDIIEALSEMLDEHNILVKSFRMGRDRLLFYNIS